MPKHKLTHVFCVMLGAILIPATFFYNQVGLSIAQQTTLPERDAKLPIVDYDAPETGDEEKREKRKKKGLKYNKSDLSVNPSPELVTTTSVSHWFYGMPSLPTLQSDVIVIGDVAAANAFLSPDKTGVYSEYAIRVDQILKTDDTTVTANQTVDAQRAGGRVRLSSGLVQSYKVANQGVPRIGGKYVLFLKRVEGDLLILTGYELRQNNVKPLDKAGLFDNYRDVGLESFMDELRQAIISPQSAPSEEYYLLIDPIEDDPDPSEPDPEPSPACAAPTPGTCTTPQTNENKLKPNQQYVVTIDPTGFSPEKISAIKQAFETWNSLSGPTHTNSGVKFVGFTETTTAPPNGTCDYCFHVRGVNGNRDSLGNTIPAMISVGTNGNTYPYIGHALMTIDLSVPLTETVGCPNGQSWSYNVLKPTVMHEIGHPLGLKDCYPGCTGSSIMGATTAKIQSPTNCDIQALKNKYAPPPSGGGGGGGEGDDGGGMCRDQWGIWGVYNKEGDLIGYEWEYYGCF